MPLYEYKCHSCGKTFEVIQKFSDETLKTHAECGGEVEKLLSAPAFHLKGTGWYATDYAKSNGAPKPEKKAETKPESTSSDSKPADSKPAAGTSTTESKPSSSN
jgi:putative FmdB family regulatory protein